MREKYNRPNQIDTSNLEPRVGDVVRVTGNEWLGHPLMASIGLVIDKQDKSGEPVECDCLVTFSGIRMWFYVSDLTVESRATHDSSGTM